MGVSDDVAPMGGSADVAIDLSAAAMAVSPVEAGPVLSDVAVADLAKAGTAVDPSVTGASSAEALAATASIDICVNEAMSYVVAPDAVFVFGRGARDGNDNGLVPLDPNDMGISGTAGTIEFANGTWWLLNRSRKRWLQIDGGLRGSLRLESGGRYAIADSTTVVLVPGAIRTHRLRISAPDGYVHAMQGSFVGPPSGTTTLCPGEIEYSDDERRVLTALFSGYLRAWPRQDCHPLSYKSAAGLLGPPWTGSKVRKRIEHLRKRLKESGVFTDGPNARYELAEYVLNHGVVGPADLAALEAERPDDV